MVRKKLLGFTKFEDVDKARSRLQSETRVIIGEEVIGIWEAVGRVSSRDIIAKEDFPSYDRSAVDGYALRAEDVYGASENNPIVLTVVGEVEAGYEGSLPEVKPGTAVLVFTGAPIPPGADAVVPVEYAVRAGDSVQILRSVPKYKNISRKGEDFSKGDLLVRRGTVLKPWHVAALAQAKIPEVFVFRKPVVGIINTGDELFDITGGGSEYGIPNSAGPLIASYVRELGGEPRYYGVVRDDLDAIRTTVERALMESHIIIITGGTSVGGKDIVPEALSSIEGSRLVFHGVNLRPGRTAGAFVINGKPVIMLSGLPVACLVGLENFLKPLFMKLMSIHPQPEPVIRARLVRRVANVVGFKSYLRVVVFREGDELLVEPLRLTGSGILSTLLKGNGILVIDENVEGIEEGSVVEVKLIGPPYDGRPTFLGW